MRSKPTERELRQLLAGDSVQRRRWLAALLQIVREQERNRVLDTMARARERSNDA
jgi:predicted ABC-type exoprotein transport system permease subunit